MKVTSIKNRAAVLQAMKRLTGESYHGLSDDALVNVLNRWSSHSDEQMIRGLAQREAIGAASW